MRYAGAPSSRQERSHDNHAAFWGRPVRELPDPHAIPFPDGPLWDRLGHELVYGREPEDVAREYGELKERLAVAHPWDITAYMEGKDAFVKEHEARALLWKFSHDT